MRILHFYKTAHPDSMGGVEQLIHQLALRTSDLGYSVDVLTLSNLKRKRTTPINNYLLYRARLDFQIASTGFSLSGLQLFNKLSKKADIIHYHFPWPYMDLAHILCKIKKPSVVTYHSDIIRQKKLLKLYRPLRNKFLSSVSQIVATSDNYTQTSEVLQQYISKVKVIPIGLDKQLYQISDQTRVRYWQNKFKQPFFLFVGVLRYYKGLHILIEAAQDLNFPIVLVGAGPIEAELKLKAKQLNLNCIYFLGKLDDKDKNILLSLCYSVIFPSHLRSEAFGVSLLEGAMFGKPMISSEIGTGTTFINIQNETGIVVPPSDPIALRQSMQYLYDNPNIAQEMGKNAQKRYFKLFTAENMLNSYITLYKNLL